MKKKKIIDLKWILIISVTSFLLSVLFSLLSELVIPNVHVIISIIVILLVILLGIIFDMVGLSVTVSDASVFNSMASKNIKSARVALKLIKNKDKVSSFCNDVIGDICGIISGSCGAVISTILILKFKSNSIVIVLLINGLIASLTIGGKALGKGVAIKNANKILNVFSKFIYIFKKK